MESQLSSIKAQASLYGHQDVYQQEVRLRELKAQLRVHDKKCAKRLTLTKDAGNWLPRMERLVQARGLDTFERQMLLLLVTSYISSEIHALGYGRSFSVGTILRAFSSTFEEQIHRRSYFYKGSKMVKEGIIRISGGTSLGMSNLLL